MPTSVVLAVWMTGCASDEPAAPEPDTRPRMDQILSPQGGKPNDAYTKRSRYDGQDYKSKSLDKKTYAAAGGDGRAREAAQAFSGSGKEAWWSGKETRYGAMDAREGGQTARTFESRYEDQAAQTKDFSGAADRYRTGEAREADDLFRTGRSRGYTTRTLGATQLSPSAVDTAKAYPADGVGQMNEEEVRRVLNKSPRER
jgi:hypothetical protein